MIETLMPLEDRPRTTSEGKIVGLATELALGVHEFTLEVESFDEPLGVAVQLWYSTGARDPWTTFVTFEPEKPGTYRAKLDVADLMAARPGYYYVQPRLHWTCSGRSRFAVTCEQVQA